MRRLLVVMFFISFLWILFLPSAYAQITPSPALDPGCIQTEIGCIDTDVKRFAGQYYKYGLGIIGGFAVLMIIFGGYQILVSHGNPKILNDGKTIISYALAGLFLAIFGYLFVEVILVDVLHIPGFG